jgi:hypothetical protein
LDLSQHSTRTRADCTQRVVRKRRRRKKKIGKICQKQREKKYCYVRSQETTTTITTTTTTTTTRLDGEKDEGQKRRKKNIASNLHAPCVRRVVEASLQIKGWWLDIFFTHFRNDEILNC